MTRAANAMALHTAACPRGVGRARRLRAVLVLALAAEALAAWLYFHLAAPGSAFHAYNTDPELAYFMDSLAPFKGQPYRGVDHPGTPLTALGTLLLAAIDPFVPSSGPDFVEDMIRRPGPFFVLAHALLIAANIACIIVLGQRALSVRRPGDAVLAAAVPASFFAFLPRSFFWTFYWSHNAIAFPAGVTVLFALLGAARRGRPLAAGTTAALAAAAGVMAATQLYFATWIVGLMVTAIVLQSVAGSGRRTLRWLVLPPAAAALGFLAGVAPAANQIGRFFGFTGRLATHQGLYGGGPAGFISPGVWASNAAALFRMAPWLFVVTGLVFGILAMLFALRRPSGYREKGLWAVALGVVLQWAATFALFGKHPSRFYLPALAAMLPVLLAVAFALARRRGAAARTTCLALAAATLLACAHETVMSVRDHAGRLAFRAAMQDEVPRVRASFAAPGAPPPLLLWGPTLPDAGCYALWGVNLYLQDAFRQEVTAVCPSEGLAWSNSVALPDGWSTEGPTPALLVMPEDVPRRFPAFAALGTPEAFGAARDPEGRRLAFLRVVVRGGRAYPRPD